MEVLEKFQRYTKNLLNGTCINNFRYNNTIEPQEIVTTKVITAAVIVGIVTAFFSFVLIPFTFFIVGLAAFVYHTAEGQQPPSLEFVEKVIHQMQGDKKRKMIS